MGNVFSILKQKKYVNFYISECLNQVLDTISYMSNRLASTDLGENKKMYKALNQLKNAAYILKRELKKNDP